MKQFFGAFFGSIIGIIVAAALAILLLVVAVKSSINEAFKDEEVGNSIVKSNSVLKLTLDGRITERSKENPLEDLLPAGPFSESSSKGLNDLTEKIKKANSDTIRAGTTNSPSAKRAGCLPPIVAGIESDTPSPGPRSSRPPSE